MASREAVLELRRAYDERRSDPVVEAALAVALARGIEVQPPGAQGHNYRPAYEQSNSEKQARRLFVDAIESWPAPELGQEIAALALATRDETSLELAAGALGSLTGRLPGSALLWTARAEVAIARHEYGEALEAAANAAGLGDPSGQRALGVTRLVVDDDPAGGARSYLDGLGAADEGALDRYHEDLAPLLSLAEEEAWAVLPDAERREWLRRKWEWRASTAARTTAERLAIHFRRLAVADDRYRRLAVRGAPPLEALVRDSLQLRLRWDDRGLIRIRHGEPDDVVRAPSGWVGPAREAWVYHGLSGSRGVFEFRKIRQWADYFAAVPAECDPIVYKHDEPGSAIGPPSELTPSEFAAFERGIFDYGLSLGAADPALAINAMRCYGIVRHGQLREEWTGIRLTEAARRADARRDLAEAFSTETAAPRFEKRVRALSSVYAFEGEDGLTTLAAFLMVPGDELTPRPVYGGVAYPLRLTLAVEDPVEQRVQRRDTLVAFRAVEQLTDSQQLRAWMQLSATPVNDATIRITLLNADHPEEGQILLANRSVPAWPTDRLSMSDLVVAEPGRGTWTRGSVSIGPMPGHQIPAGRTFRLFYEIYGLRTEERVRTRITVAPAMEPDLLSRLKDLFGGDRVLELSFDETLRPGPDGVLQVDRAITPSLDPGRYTLQVTVERPTTGELVATHTRILFLER